MKSHLQKLPPMAAPLAFYCQRLQALADGCERLQTVANIETTGREQGSTPRPPELNENPSLRIREKHLALKAVSLTIALLHLLKKGGFVSAYPLGVPPNK